METRYRTTLRPTSTFTLPDNLRWEYVEVPAALSSARPDLPRSQHLYGVFTADRTITGEEMKHFDIAYA